MKTSEGGTWAFRQTRELVALGIEVHAMLPGTGALIDSYESAGVVVHEGQSSIDTRRPYAWHTQRERLRSVVACVRPDIIHSHFVGTTLGVRAALGKEHPTPRLFQVPGPIHLEHAIFRQAEILSAGCADYWIGSCEWTCDRYRQSGVANDRIFLSYYGTDVDNFRPRKKGQLRTELGLEPSTQIVGSVAYVYAPKRYLGQRRGSKGHEDLIDAVRMLRETRNNLVVVFVGGPWGRAHAYEKKIHAYAKQQLGDAAYFLGTRSGIPDLYADFDVAVHASYSENVGGAAESLLLGVPTVATNVGGFPDVVRPRETGWLVRPKDPKAMAVAISDVLENPQLAHSYAAAGQKQVQRLFDVRRTAREIRDIYDTILDHHN